MQNAANTSKLRLFSERKIVYRYRRGPLLGQSSVSSGDGRSPLQDEDHSRSYPYSFLCLYSMRSGRPPEWRRSGPVVADS